MAATPRSTETDRATASPMDRHASPVADHGTATGRKSSMAVAAMVVGIVSMPLFFFWPAALVLGVVAIVLGAVAKAQIKREGLSNGGQATAGIVCGVIGILAAIAFIAIIAASVTN